jgi:large subunit ribosomal protein L19
MGIGDIMAKVERENMSENTVDIKAGDTALVSMKIREGDKERVQQFQGTVIQVNGAGRGRTVTVRKVSTGNVYVERIFPINSPLVSEIKILRRGKTRRARLFYLRRRTGKATRIEELQDMGLAPVAEPPAQA